MIGLRSRIDSWLDAEPPAGRSDGDAWLTDVVARGRRRRARRRVATVAICGAVAVVAVAVPLSGVLGGSPRTALPADQGPGPASTPPSTTPASDAPGASPSVVSTGGSNPGTGAGRVTVHYPDGAGGTTPVTWPAPGSGLPWAIDAPSVPAYGTAAPATPGAADLRDALLAAVPGEFFPSTSGDSAAVTGQVDGLPTAYRVTIDAAPGISATAARAQPATYLVSMTRGGLAKDPADPLDYCGSWPDDRTGLGNRAGLSYYTAFEFNQPPRCAVVVRPDGQTVIHLVAEQGRHGEVTPSPLHLVSFGVRPDGTAVSAHAWAALDAGWSASTVAATLDRLDRLVETLPYPSRP